MKEGISVTTIFQIAILFILLFTAIMCLTINNSNAFGLKDEIVNIIELNEGNFFEDSAATQLNNEIIEAVDNNSYRITGSCPDEEGWQGFQRNGERTNGDSASICIRCVDVTGGIDNYLSNNPTFRGYFTNDDFINGHYYQVMLFYQLSIPVVSQVYNFKVVGDTKIIYNYGAGNNLCS